MPSMLDAAARIGEQAAAYLDASKVPGYLAGGPVYWPGVLDDAIQQDEQLRYDLPHERLLRDRLP